MKKFKAGLILFFMCLFSWSATGFYIYVSQNSDIYSQVDNSLSVLDGTNSKDFKIEASMYKANFFEVSMAFAREIDKDDKSMNFVVLSIGKVITVKLGKILVFDITPGIYMGLCPYSFTDELDNEISKVRTDMGLYTGIKVMLKMKKRGFIKSIDLGYKYMMSFNDSYYKDEKYFMERKGIYLGVSI